MTDHTERARLAATQLLDEHNFSMSVCSYEIVHALVAAAYAIGSRDGFEDGIQRAGQIIERMGEPSFTLTEAPHGR